MSEFMDQFTPLIEHVAANPVAYGIGTVVAFVIIYFTRPYSTSIIFYSLEIAIYLFIMHAVIHVLAFLAAGFSNQTTMRNVFDGEARGTVEWTTPLIRFWERDVYDPTWLLWLEIVFVIVIIGLVRYYRPMKVQTKFKGQMVPEPSKTKTKKKGKDDGDDDDWGVPTTRRFTMPDDFAKKIGKNE